jgi:hypothetical protein
MNSRCPGRGSGLCPNAKRASDSKRNGALAITQPAQARWRTSPQGIITRVQFRVVHFGQLDGLRPCLTNCCSRGVGPGQGTRNRGRPLGRKSLPINDFGADEVFATHTAPKASEQQRTGQSPHKHQLMILPDVADTDDLDASTLAAAQK